MELQISYVICTTPRTGSSLLSQGLTATGLCGYPEEHFGREDFRNQYEILNTSEIQSYLENIINRGMTPNGVFGLKLQMKPRFFKSVIEFLSSAQRVGVRRQTSGDVFSDAFPNLHYIWLTRRNKIRQAVSWSKAIQTGIWHREVNNPDQPSFVDLQFSFERIDNLVQKIILREAAWEEFFATNHIQPLTIVYEDVVRTYSEDIMRIIDFLEVDYDRPLKIGPPLLLKQADSTSDQWVNEYRVQKQHGWQNLSW